MHKGRYIIENSIKNLVRMEGIILNSLLLIVLSSVTFLFFNAFFFFSHWIQWIELESGKDNMVLQSTSIVVTNLSIFKGVILLLFIALFLATIGYLRRTAIQYFKIQQKDYIVMSFIGQTSTMISVEFALQSLMLAVGVLVLGIVIADYLFINLLIGASEVGPFSDVVKGYRLSFSSQLVLIIVASSSIFGRLFFYMKRQLSYFFNQKFVQ